MLALAGLLWLAWGGGWMLGLLVLTALMPPMSMAANLYVRKHLDGSLCLPTVSAKASPCTGTLRLENRSWLPAAKLTCRVRAVNDLTGEETVLDIPASLGPRSAETVAFIMESPFCGRIYACIQSVRLMDWFGLFSLNVPMKAAARMTVLPDLFTCEVEPVALSASCGDDTASRRGDDHTEVFQLREYRSGDDIRQIHWKLSSKLDTLLLREPSQSVSRSLLVFWDKRQPTAPERMDAMAEAAASVCQGLCDSGAAFDLCWTEGEEPELHQIRDAEDLLRTVPALVTRMGTPECPDPDTAGYGLVVRIGAEMPPDGSDGNTVHLICTDGTEPSGRCVAFSPADYIQRLERLEL